MSKDWNIRGLDTARSVDYLSDIEKDIVLELNKARQDPKKYAHLYLTPRLQHFKDTLYQPPGESIPLRTKSGPKGVQSAIDALGSIKSLPPLQPNPGLSKAAKDHVLDIGAKGKQGSTGTDGSAFTDRINRYGFWIGSAGETLALGQRTAPNVVQAWLISDGDPHHGNRDTVFSPDFQQVGVAFGDHKSEFKHIAVAEYVKDYGHKIVWTPEQIKARVEGSPDRDEPDAANFDVAALDVGKNAPFLSGFEKDVLLELNKLRSNPAKYIKLYSAAAHKVPPAANKAPPAPPFKLARGIVIVPPGAKGERAKRGTEHFGKWSGQKQSLKISGQYVNGRDVVFGFLRSYSDFILGKTFLYAGVSVQPYTHGSQVDLILVTEYHDA